MAYEKILEALIISLNVSIFSTLISLLVSLPLGAIIAIKIFYGRSILIACIHALTSIPPVCAGLIVYLIISRSGPLGWTGLLYTPTAMIIAQSLIIIPIMSSLILKNIEQDFKNYKEELITYGASFYVITKLLLLNRYGLYKTIALIGFGRAISEYGAAAIVGGSIDHVTRNITSSIALETSKGNLDVAIGLGGMLILISFTLSFIVNRKESLK
jgi:tungstate transport system permease protein|tara:strand:+ start:1090 stop:1731 length:642 start_codon:yes stop_codon:yes gene_type:complete